MITATICAVLALPAASAQAAYPGQNGKIAYVRDNDVWTMNADGSGQANVTNTAGVIEAHPVWSPDGTKIAFLAPSPQGWYDVWSMNPDGSGRTNLTASYVSPCGQGCSEVVATGVTWSPDGTQLAFTNDLLHFEESISCLATVDADGTDVTAIPTCPPGELNAKDASDPAWSPDGRTILLAVYGGEPDIWAYDIATSTYDQVTHRPISRQANWSPSGHKVTFSRDDGLFNDYYFVAVMNPDGSSVTDIAGPYQSELEPAWSPDGSRIVFARSDLYAVNPDGSVETNLTNTPAATESQPDWQPIPINSYPRPKGATPFRVALATAYDQCTAPDRTHGPPLAFPSCSNPQQTSGHLTVGTGDSNGLPARNDGDLKLATQVGIPGGPDDADVNITLMMDDVFTTSLADYTGEIRAHLTLQITDKDNTPHPGGPGAATSVSVPLNVIASCSAVPDPQEGSICSTATSADALAPGTVKEGRRAVWQLGRVEVYDGGPDGDASTPAGDTLFATQGLFIP